MQRNGGGNPVWFRGRRRPAQQVPQAAQQAATGSEIRSEFFWTMFLPLGEVLFYKTPFIYAFYLYHVYVLFRYAGGASMVKTPPWYEPFAKRMAYPLVAVPFIPQVLDCCLHFLRPDAKTLSDLASGTAWEDALTTAALVATLGVYRVFISGQDGSRFEHGCFHWMMMSAWYGMMSAMAPQERFEFVPLMAKAAAMVAIVYCAIHLCAVLSNEVYKLVVSVLVVAVTLCAGQMLIYKDMPTEGSIFEILHACNFVLGILLLVVPALLEVPAVDLKLRARGWIQ